MKFQYALLPLVASFATLPAIADSWTIDSQHTSAGFQVRHMMISNVHGTITGATGTADYDGKSVKSLKVDATLDPKTVNTSEPDRDKHLRSADFFDTDKYQTITFKSKRVEDKGKGKFKLIGDLTMHGVTKEVALDVDGPTPIVKDPYGNQRLGASASAIINRKDFGISYNKTLDNGGVALSEDVGITLDIELKKAKTAAADSAKTVANTK